MANNTAEEGHEEARRKDKGPTAVIDSQSRGAPVLAQVAPVVAHAYKGQWRYNYCFAVRPSAHWAPSLFLCVCVFGKLMVKQMVEYFTYPRVVSNKKRPRKKKNLR